MGDTWAEEWAREIAGLLDAKGFLDPGPSDEDVEKVIADYLREQV